MERESNLTIRINDIEANKRLIVKRINKIVGILNGNIRSKTLFYHRVIVLDREYNGLFKTIEKLSDEWIWLLYKRDDVVDQIKKIRS